MKNYSATPQIKWFSIWLVTDHFGCHKMSSSNSTGLNSLAIGAFDGQAETTEFDGRFDFFVLEENAHGSEIAMDDVV